jgi:ABC-2 type transport system ATP-binding protein
MYRSSGRASVVTWRQVWRPSRLLAALASLAILLCLPSAVSAETTTVTSFDGTKIHVNFFPAANLAPGQTAATVMVGPGWSSPGDTNENDETDPTTGIIGLGPLRDAGFNVVTWDPRGFGASGGTVEVDSPDYEARDVSAIITWLAQQPQALLDGPGDPRVGMAGGSYGGGIQLDAAAIDPRIDAIVPDIAWNSLLTSLYKEQDIKLGWATELTLLGEARGRLNPLIGDTYITGLAGAPLSPAEVNFFATRGPGDLVRRIHVPTMLIQGTVDNLFTLQEAVTNYTILRQDGVPVKMLWFCGGHGICITNPGDTALIQQDTIAWLKRYLDRDRSVNTGPSFEWVDQDGVEHTASDYPLAPGAPLTADGSGTLPLLLVGGSGPVLAPATVQSPSAGSVSTLAGPIAPAKALNAVNVTINAPAATTDIVGAPTVTLTYHGIGTGETGENTHVLAQIVDNSTGDVLNNQITPIPVILDGQTHTVTQPLEILSGTAKPGETFTLQIVANSLAYQQQRAVGAITFSHIQIELPTVNPGATPPGYGAIAPNGCTDGGTVVVRMPRGTRRARAVLGGHTIARGRQQVTLQLVGLGSRTVRVQIIATSVRGTTTTLTRRLRACP